jgi:hypothetical protein
MYKRGEYRMKENTLGDVPNKGVNREGGYITRGAVKRRA